jgi:hypothetical protein
MDTRVAWSELLGANPDYVNKAEVRQLKVKTGDAGSSLVPPSSTPVC